MPVDDDLDGPGLPAPDGLDLGRLLRSDDSRTRGRLDADAVIRRARRRRGTRIAGVTTAWVLAGAVVVSGGTIGLRLLAPGGSSGSSSSVASGSAGSKPDGVDGSAPTAAPQPRDVDDSTCGGPAPVSTTSANGLSLAIELPAAATPGSTIPAMATLSNSGQKSVSLSVEQPRGVMTMNGVVTWHSPVVPTVSPRSIQLAPGASTTFSLVVAAQACRSGADDSTSLPPAAAGGYAVFATVVVHLSDHDEVIVSGPAHLRIR